MRSIAQQELEADGWDAVISDRNLWRVVDSAEVKPGETDKEMIQQLGFRDFVTPKMHAL